MPGVQLVLTVTGTIESLNTSALTQRLALQLGVDHSSVTLVSTESGSVILTYTVLFATQHAADEAVLAISSASLPSLSSDLGVAVSAADASATLLRRDAPSPPPPTTPPPLPFTPASVDSGLGMAEATTLAIAVPLGTCFFLALSAQASPPGNVVLFSSP